MKNQINLDALRINSRHVGGDNTASVVTITKDQEKYHAVRRIDLSYDVVPSGGKITIAFGASPTTVWEIDVTSSGPGPIDFHDNPIHNAEKKDEQLVVTLAAGGSGCIGKLNVVYS